MNGSLAFMWKWSGNYPILLPSSYPGEESFDGYNAGWKKHKLIGSPSCLPPKRGHKDEVFFIYNLNWVWQLHSVNQQDGLWTSQTMLGNVKSYFYSYNRKICSSILLYDICMFTQCCSVLQAAVQVSFSWTDWSILSCNKSLCQLTPLTKVSICLFFWLFFFQLFVYS